MCSWTFLAVLHTPWELLMKREEFWVGSALGALPAWLASCSMHLKAELDLLRVRSYSPCLPTLRTASSVSELQVIASLPARSTI